MAVVKRRRGGTKVSRKNQITLPVTVLAAARVRPGDALRVEAQGDGRIVLSRDRDPVSDHAGAVPGLSEATDLEGLRSEWIR